MTMSPQIGARAGTCRVGCALNDWRMEGRRILATFLDDNCFAVSGEYLGEVRANLRSLS